MLRISTIFLVKNFDCLHERGIKIPPSHPNLIHIYNQLKTILLKKKNLMQTSIVYFYLQIRSVTSKSIVIKKHEKYLYQTKRTKGGARDTFQGGHCRLSLDTGFEKKQGRTPKYYLIYIILNPDDPLLETLIDYRLISTYWKIDSM